MSVFLQIIKMKATHCAARNIYIWCYHIYMMFYKRKKTERRVVYNRMLCACAGVMAVNDNKRQSEGCAYKYQHWEQDEWEGYKGRLHYTAHTCHWLHAVLLWHKLPKLWTMLSEVQNKMKSRLQALFSVSTFPEITKESSPLLWVPWIY